MQSSTLQQQQHHHHHQHHLLQQQHHPPTLAGRFDQKKALFKHQLNLLVDDLFDFIFHEVQANTVHYPVATTTVTTSNGNTVTPLVAVNPNDARFVSLNGAANGKAIPSYVLNVHPLNNSANSSGQFLIANHQVHQVQSTRIAANSSSTVTTTQLLGANHVQSMNNVVIVGPQHPPQLNAQVTQPQTVTEYPLLNSVLTLKRHPDPVPLLVAPQNNSLATNHPIKQEVQKSPSPLPSTSSGHSIGQSEVTKHENGHHREPNGHYDIEEHETECDCGECHEDEETFDYETELQLLEQEEKARKLSKLDVETQEQTKMTAKKRKPERVNMFPMKVQALKCYHCEDMLPNREQLNIHLDRIHHVHPIRCRVCSFTCDYPFELGKHMADDHPGQSDFVCNQCSSRFTYPHGLYLHQITQHEQGIYACALANCSFTSSIRTDVRKHIRANHREHMMVHNAKRLKKNKLNRVTKPKSTTQSIASTSSTSQSRRQPITCTEPGCGQQFDGAYLLRRHERNCHVTDRPYRCIYPGCLTGAFKAKKHALSHIRVVHFKCPKKVKDRTEAQSRHADRDDPNQFLQVAPGFD